MKMCLLYCIFACPLLAAAYIDSKQFILPDKLILPCLILAPPAAILAGRAPLDTLLGFLGGLASLGIFAALYAKVRGRTGIGQGDIKLLGILGALCGWKSLWPILMVSALCGAGYSLWHRERTIPFGPFLCLGALLYIICEEKIHEIF